MKIGSEKVALKAIKKYDNIVIFHHIRPDGDCLGSQAGLAELIRTNFPKKKVFTPGNNVDTYNFMNYHFDPKDQIDFTNSLGIVVDASSSDRIQDSDILLEKKCTATLRIDHHPNGSDIEYDYLWIDEHFVAAAEMIAKIAQTGKLKISTKAAEHIFLGMVTDSGRFLYPDTSARTHQLAAMLYEKGNLQPWEMFKNLNQRSMQDIKFVGEILSNFEKKGRTLYYKITQDVMKKHGYDSTKAAIFVNELANIEDNSCWAFFVELEDNAGIRVRLRSNGPIVNNIARKYNGGGHDNAAGCNISSWDEVETVVDLLNEEIKRWESQ